MARTRKATSATERRGDRRIKLRRRVIVAFSVPPDDDHMPAVIFDISRTGIGLIAPRPLEAGTRVTLAWEFGRKSTHRMVAATVIHASASRDRAWRVGCTFDIPLEVRDVRSFLRHCAKL